MQAQHQINQDPKELAQAIKAWGVELGFQQLGISHTKLHHEEARLHEWLRQGYHGDMAYMAKHGLKRSQPERLIPGTLSIICARMNYQPEQTVDPINLLKERSKAYISRYATGRDYHKVLRKRLQKLAERIVQNIGPFSYRVFTDSAPVLEKPLAVHAGLGWMGKHTNMLHREAGSWFFIGEIYTHLDLAADEQTKDHCGSCEACIDACPTGAIIAPYVLDARLCISYLTIEHKAAIPENLRPLIGNRIYGCDDCQLVCPWNRFSQTSAESDFQIRKALEAPELVTLFSWSEQQFKANTAGSAMGRINYLQWLRNIAVALGNADPDPHISAALEEKRYHPSGLVREHVQWAIDNLARKRPASPRA